MAHTYAGILGPLAMFAVLARGIIHASASEEIVAAACICLALFACLGAVVGALAGQTVEESVRATVSGELSAVGSAVNKK